MTMAPLHTVEKVRALVAAGRNGEAAAAGEERLGLISAGAETCLLNGLLLKIKGRRNEAMTAYDMALSFAPDALPAYLCIADILAENGWLHSALVVMENARQAAPFTAEAQEQLDGLRARLENMKRSGRGETA